MVLRFLVVLAFSAAPAFAECLSADDFSGGEVPVALKAGDEWRLTRGEDEGQVIAEYRDRYGEPLRWQFSHLGVYPAHEQQSLTVDPASGNETPFPQREWALTTTYSAQPPAPEPGGNWSASGTTRGTLDGQERAWDFSVTYTFDPVKTVTLSGCRYTAIGVNGTFHSGKDDWTGRWIYFPDLAVGVQTRGMDSRTGENWANGMVGLGY